MDDARHIGRLGVLDDRLNLLLADGLRLRREAIDLIEHLRRRTQGVGIGLFRDISRGVLAGIDGTAEDPVGFALFEIGSKALGPHAGERRHIHDTERGIVGEPRCSGIDVFRPD